MLRINKDTREMFVYDAIGPSWAGMVGADDVVAALDLLGPGDVKVRLNTPGGDMDEAVAAVANLKRHNGNVEVSIDGLAASAGTFFLAKEFKVTASPGARVMIHEPWVVTWGNSTDLRKTAEVLDKAFVGIIDMYEGRMTRAHSREEIENMTKAETWFTAKEALAAGLIDAIGEEVADESAQAKVHPGLAAKLRNVPKDLIGKQPEEEIVVEYEPRHKHLVAKARLSAMRKKSS